MVRRALRVSLTWLADEAGIKNENKMETRRNPSTNFGNLSQMTPKPGRSSPVAGDCAVASEVVEEVAKLSEPAGVAVAVVAGVFFLVVQHEGEERGCATST